MRRVAIGLVVGALVSTAAANDVASRDGLWLKLERMPAEMRPGEPWIRPHGGQAVFLDFDGMKRALASAPLEGTPAAADPIVIWLPKPDGAFERFAVVESPVYEAGLQPFIPEVRTFAGVGIDDPAATVRLDHTQHGFHSQVLSPNGAYWIDPWTQGDTAFYTSYRKSDLANLHQWACHVLDAQAAAQEAPELEPTFGPRAVVTRREFTLAVAATAQYTDFHSAAVPPLAADGQAAVVTSVNRLTGVYETELAVRLVLPANNINIVFTDSATDGLSSGNPGTMLGESTTVINGGVGSANYDVGHVYDRAGGGGVANLGVVCTANKARGVSTFNSPTGDPFTIDYVAHELGHQFNAPHTFGGCGGGGGVTYEPGSGSTIMAYAGICGGDNLQSHSDPVFHHSSVETIQSFLSSRTCDTETSSGNNTPTFTQGANFTVPRSTPFFLTPASSSDPDGDTLFYSWEQRDSRTGGLVTTDPGSGPCFRARPPTTNPTQYFPPLDDVADGTLDAGDVWPNTARPLNFRLTVRDNEPGAGGTVVNSTNRVITINTNAGPFRVTAPNTAVTWTGLTSQTVTWDVAGTTANGINCANVDILLSTDNGLTWSQVLVAGTPNDGSETITVPNTPSNTCRIIVRGTNHIFYDMSDRGFRILSGASNPNTPTNVAANPPTVCLGQQSQLSATVGAGEVVDWFTGSCGGTFVGTGNPLAVTPGSSATYFARARRTSDGAISTGCGSVSVTVNPDPVAPSSASSDRNNFCASDAGSLSLSVSGGSGTTLRWFAGSCGGPSIGTGNPLVIDSPDVSTTYFARWETICGNSDCASVAVTVAPGPTAPASASSSRDGFCPSDAGTISLSADGGSGTTLEWFTGSCGGTPIGAGNPLVVDSPAVTTTYYARWMNACGSSTCAEVTVTPTAGADFNGDGFIDFFDFDDYVSCFEGLGCPPGRDADFNGDGFTDFFDFDDYVAAFEAGC